ncbi:hypothetical protein [Dinghuibacter silviterrae]|uniref:Lipoprotein n=1 Tax=Dinghuibacter silviterrae TaxID=1539049 RepID=A0A4R8DXX4_9BACT|nr:hypothetical protein [Dinghuibacter silviterrae]TDX02297.1 hypothetical protein EDB95_3352 [Dinghuibacter silviterrae]
MKLSSLILTTAVLLTACHRKTETAEELLKEAAKTPGVNVGHGNYTITAPEGWTEFDTTFSGIKITFVQSVEPVGQFYPSVNVVTASTKLDLDAYEDDNLNAMEQKIGGYKFLDKGAGQLQGHGVRWIRFQSAVNGILMDDKAYDLVSEGVGYVITCTAGRGYFNRSAAAFDTIVNSFTLK